MMMMMTLIIGTLACVGADYNADNDDNTESHDKYIMMKCVSVCNEKRALSGWFPWFFKIVSWFLVGFHGFSR